MPANLAPVTDGIVHDTLRRIERAEGVRKPTAIVMSSRSIEPGVIGIRRPVLVWPRHLTWRPERLHTSKRSSPTRSVTSFVATICSRRRRWSASAGSGFTRWYGGSARGSSTNASAPATSGCWRWGERPSTYAESILKTCELCVASPLINVAGVTGGDLKQRIVRIMKNVPPVPLGVSKTIALGLAALLTAFVPIVSSAGSRPATAADAQEPDREVHRPGGRVTSPRLIRETKPQSPRAPWKRKCKAKS